MKITIEMESEAELDEFVRWRQHIASSEKTDRRIALHSAMEHDALFAGMPMSRRLQSVLWNEGIDTVESAEKLTENEWLRLPGCGAVVYREVKHWLKAVKNR